MKIIFSVPSVAQDYPKLLGEKLLEPFCRALKGQNNIAREKLFLCHELYCQETSIRGGLPSKSREKTYAIKGFGYLEKIYTPSGQIRKNSKTTNKWLFYQQTNRKDIFLTLGYYDRQIMDRP
ncbi:hypothetical protein [Pseudomonas capsici]|uniref:hypothetical protein n=1 Tax=Pseudomonas capsici TaxID=2810614 RepID=UPI0021F22D87|nr:hypothetical protein [Pseudomonas capsici]MCV4341529.1 hypothetical protein [Pseudomonas capsici]